MMTPRLYRSLQALILALLGLLLLNKAWNGTLFWYINARFLPLTMVGALSLLWLARARIGPEANHAQQHDHDHDAGHKSGWVLLILTVPLVLGLLIPAQPLGASAVANKGLAAAPLAAGSQASPLQLEMSPTDRTVLDWVRAFSYSSDPGVYLGQPADVIGFVYHDPRLVEGQFLLARFTITCCVADAAAIGIIVNWDEADSLPDNAWMRVQGFIEMGDLDGQRMPAIRAELLENVPPPDQPYLYN